MASNDIKVTLSADDRTRAAFQSATNNLKGMERAASNLRGSLAGIAGGITAGAFVAFAKNTLDAADALNDMSQRTGVAVKDLASLRTAAEQNGTSLEDVGKAVSKLNLSFSQAQGGAKEQAESLKRLGINSTDARERFFQLADAYAKAGDKTAVLSDLQKVLGKNYQEMIPLLAQGGDELRKSAQASESFADAMARLAPEADKFNDQLAQLKTNSAGLAASILTNVVPSLNEYLGALQKITSEGTLLEKIGFFTLGYVPERIANQVGDLTERIAGYRQEIAKLKAEGKDTAALEKTLGELITRQVEVLQKPPTRTGGAAAAAARTAPGRTAKPTDPLAGIIGATEIAQLAEYEKLLGMLNARYDFGRKNSALYAQALEQLNKKFGVGQDKMLDALGSGSYLTGDKETAEFIKEQQDAINALNTEMAGDKAKAADDYAAAIQGLVGDTDIAKTAAFQKNIDLLNQAFFDGVIGAEQYDQAMEKITSSKAQEGIKESKDLMEELGLAMESALGEAIRGGGDASDVFKALLKDILQLIAQMYILKPLMESLKTSGGSTSGGSSGSGIGSLLSSASSGIGEWISSLFTFANGGIMGPMGPMPLHKYAGGGIANSPQLAMFGEGSMPEAYVPLPDGRRIPVAMKGGGGTVINNISIRTDNPSNIRASRGQVLADIQNELRRAQRNA